MTRIKELLLPRFLSFWMLAGFLVFWAVGKTGSSDLVTDIKLIVIGVLLVYVLAYGALERQFDFARLCRDRGLALVVLSAAAYLIWITLANTVFSSAPDFTLIGWPEWHSGYLLYAMCVLLFLCAALICRAEGLQPALTLAFVMVTLAAVFCVLEYLGFNPLSSSGWFESMTHTQVNVPLSIFPLLFAGNSGYISAMWLLMAPLPWLALAERPRFAASFWLVLAIGIAADHGKTTVLLFALLMLLLGGYALSRRRWRLTLVALAALVLAVSGTVVYPPLQQALFSAGLVERNRNFKLNTLESLSGRRNLWTGALIGWKERPLTGWGLETLQQHYFDLVPQSVLDDFGREYLNLKPSETTIHFGYLLAAANRLHPTVPLRQARVLIVKPHSFLVEELYSHGLPGLVLALTLFLSSAAYVWRSRDLTARVLLVAWLLYAVYLSVWFLTLSVAPLAFMLLGTSVALAAGRRQSRAVATDPTDTFSSVPERPLQVAGGD